MRGGTGWGRGGGGRGAEGVEDGGSGQGVSGPGEESVRLGADLLWGPVIETLQLFLPPPLVPSIKYWYLEVCAWHGPHVGKLGTDVVVPLLQVLHRTLLRTDTERERQMCVKRKA